MNAASNSIRWLDSSLTRASLGALLLCLGIISGGVYLFRETLTVIDKPGEWETVYTLPAGIHDARGSPGSYHRANCRASDYRAFTGTNLFATHSPTEKRIMALIGRPATGRFATA